jgi:hypothetical protein
VLQIAKSFETLKISLLGATKKPKRHFWVSCVHELVQSSGTLKICLLGETETPKGDL